MRATLDVALGATLICLAVGCGGYVELPETAGPISRELTVEVRNYNFYDANIYAWDSGERLRLGMAQGKSTSHFTFRWDLEELSFIIDFIGAGELLGEVIAIEPGDDLVLIIGQEDHRRAQRPERTH